MKKFVIYFIEVNGVKKYKTDSFFTMSDDAKFAKPHSYHDEDPDRFFKTLCYLPDKKEKDFFRKRVDKLVTLQGGLFGLQVIQNGGTASFLYTVPQPIELSDPVYFKIIDDVSPDGIINITDYKIIDRNNKINDIIN